MIANFFKKSKPINTLIIIGFLFFVYAIVTIINLPEQFDFNFFIKRSFFFLIVLLILFGLYFIISKNSLTKDNSYAIVLFVFMMSIFSFTVLDYKLLIVNLLLFFAYRRIYSLRTTKNTQDKLFDSAFWIGIASLIYPWCSMLLLLIFTALFLFDKSTWRNILIPLIGFLCPIFIYAVYLIAIDNFEFFDTLFNFKSDFSFEAYNSLKILIPLSIISGLIIWSILPTTLKINAVNNEFKSSWFLLINHFFLLIIVILPWEGKNGNEFLFLFFPIVIIFTNYLQIVEEKWFKEVFLYSFLVLTLAIHLL